MGRNVPRIGEVLASRLQLSDRSSSQAKWQRLDFRGLEKYPNLSATARLSKTVKNTWSLMLQLAGKSRQHFGPQSRSPDLWPRQDLMFFSSRDHGRILLDESPKSPLNTLTDAFAKVGAVEERIGYRFNDRMLCIQALQNANGTPLVFNGTYYPVIRNNRLALLGDRVLSLALCEMWYKSERTPREINLEPASTSC